MQVFENENWILSIQEEQEPTNPRSLDYTDCNVTKMVCFHRGYKLGDDHDYKQDDYNSWDELGAAIKKNENVVVILPMYMYDHSGQTIATEPFSCRWDSSQIGFVYVTKEMLFEHIEIGRKRLSKNSVKKAIDAIKCEVETYKQYIEGDVYWYSLTNKITKEEDSCGGFYGSNIWENGIADYLPAVCVVDLYNKLKSEYGENKFIEDKIKQLT